MFILGLTGPIASGKSMIAEDLSNQGYKLINVDELGHDLLSKTSLVHDQILDLFHTTDRAELREIVFNDEHKLKQLNALIHPLIKIKVKEQLDALRGFTHHPSPITHHHSGVTHPHSIVIDAALLFEIGLADYCDKIMGVWAKKALLAERLAAKGWSTSLLTKVLNVQKDKHFLKEHCDWVIENDGSREELFVKLSKLLPLSNLKVGEGAGG